MLERMGVQDILSPRQEMNAREDKTTELKLYSPQSGGLIDSEYDEMEPLEGRDLATFQDVILHGIEDERMRSAEERGLMASFDGSDAVNEKVVSIFPSVEVVDGAYGYCKIERYVWAIR